MKNADNANNIQKYLNRVKEFRPGAFWRGYFFDGALKAVLFPAKPGQQHRFFQITAHLT
jgi:hypothetical protein